METYFENRFTTYSLVQDILYVYYKENQYITMAAAKTIVRDRLRLQDHISYPVLCNLTNIYYIDSYARRYLAHKGSLMTVAVALFCPDKSVSLMGTHYLHVSVPSVPTEIFSSEQKAFEYLKNFKKSYI